MYATVNRLFQFGMILVMILSTFLDNILILQEKTGEGHGRKKSENSLD